MSNIGNGRPPRSDPEWARRVEDRLRHLESSDTTRIGGWVLSTNDAGQVMATAPGRAPHPITPEKDPEPDVVATPGFPLFTVRRTATSTHNAYAGYRLFAGDWYDMVDRLPLGWTFDSTVNSLTVDTALILSLSIAQKIAANQIGDRHFSTVLYLNGDRCASGQSAYYANSLAAFQLRSTFDNILVAPGDVITPGYWCSESPLGALTADADGVDSRFEARLIAAL